LLLFPFIFSLRLRLPPCTPLFPYTTLFRSGYFRRPPRARAAPRSAVRSECEARRRRCRPERSVGAWPIRARSGQRCFRSNDLRRSEEHTSELQSPYDLVCRLLLEKKKKKKH